MMVSQSEPDNKTLILCVDDDEFILKFMRSALEHEGYRVLTAKNGAVALAAFSALPVDIVTLDYDMPGMNGGQVANAMTRMKPHIPKLLFSGNTNISHEEMRAFQGHCSKPCSLCTLLSQIRAVTSLAKSA